jgi:hypothetical protein
MFAVAKHSSLSCKIVSNTIKKNYYMAANLSQHLIRTLNSAHLTNLIYFNKASSVLTLINILLL